jgi:hypothetical protein
MLRLLNPRSSNPYTMPPAPKRYANHRSALSRVTRLSATLASVVFSGPGNQDISRVIGERNT